MTVHDRPFGRSFEHVEVGDLSRHRPVLGGKRTSAPDHRFAYPEGVFGE